MTFYEVVGFAIRWYVAISLLAWIIYPLLFRALAGLPDRGITLARPLGLLLAGFLPWWLSAVGITPYETWIVVSVPILGMLPVWLYEIRRRELGRFLWRERHTILVAELGFGLLFGGYVVFRCFNPDIAFTEKPMELAMLTSSISAHSMPPPDPWFAGETTNYYYLGYVLAALPARLMEIRASVAFNLELATLFASATIAAAGTAANLVRGYRLFDRISPWLSAALGGLFLVGVGNLVTPIELLSHPRNTLSSGWWQGVGWRASRVIVDAGSALGRATETINEFPAFTFVLGDLHPHVLAYPIFISAIAVAIALARSAHITNASRRITLTLAGIVLGALYAMNSWDMPPAFLLITLGVMLCPDSSNSFFTIVRSLGVVIVVAIVAAFPFLLHYTSPLGANSQDIPAAVRDLPLIGTLAQTVGLVGWPKSSFAELIKVHGLFLTVLVPALLTLALCSKGARRPDRRALVVLPLLLTFLAIAARFPAILLVGAPFVLATWLVLNTDAVPGTRLLAGLAAIATSMVLVTEVVFLIDAFGDRMNTVFKVYFQVWAIFAITAAVALPILLVQLRRWVGMLVFAPILFLTVILIAAASTYPPISAYRWTNGFDRFQGIDGLNFISRNAPDEARAIEWLRDNAMDGDRILEAPGCSYGVSQGLPHDRVSMATGLPTIVGWQFHEFQWRNGVSNISQELERRQQDARAVFNAPGSDAARAIIDRYEIRYVYVGTFEQSGYDTDCQVGPPYNTAGLAEFDQLGWPIAFQSGQITIYQVPF